MIRSQPFGGEERRLGRDLAPRTARRPGCARRSRRTRPRCSRAPRPSRSVSGVASRSGLGDARQQPHRPDAGVLVESLADREAQPPEADVIRHVGPADRAEVDRVEPLQALQPVRVHHAAGFQVVLAAPGERFEREAKARRRSAPRAAPGPAVPPGRLRRRCRRRGSPRYRKRAPPVRSRPLPHSPVRTVPA